MKTGKAIDTADAPRIAFYLPDLAGGGAERITLTLCDALRRRGRDVALVVDHRIGDNAANAPAGLAIYELLGKGALRRFTALARGVRSPGVLARAGLETRKPYFAFERVAALAAWFDRHTPDVLICGLGYAPFIAHWAGALARSRPVVVHVEHNTPSRAFLADDLSLRRLVRLNDTKRLARAIYPFLDAIVAVSDGVAADTADYAQLARSRVTTIYNPIPVASIRARARAPVAHPWLNKRSFPLVVTAGRLVGQKNFPLLFKALAQLSTHPSARLIVLGDGPLRADLANLARALGIADRIDLAGWQENPYPFMSGCDVFVQSSDREGLSTALIEALACGCRIVATDCPSGPREILDDGRFGAIVPMHDASELAAAIDRCIADTTHDPQRAIDRAEQFSVERAADAYEALVAGLLGDRCAVAAAGKP